MALTMWGQLIIQTATPAEAPVQVGTLWVDTTGTATLKVCTSISPYTFAAITGGGGGAPDPHAASHENSGSDEISVVGLSGLLADGQTPLAHKTSHQDGGADEIVVTGLAGLLVDAQTPLAHKTSHQSGGSDAIKLDDLAAPDDNTDLDATTSLHGLAPKATAPAAGLLSVLAIGNGATVRSDTAIFDTTNPAALGTAAPGTQVVAARRDHVHTLPALDAVAAPTDITTLNASTTAHGLLKKLSNVATEFMNGVGNWATPAGGAANPVRVLSRDVVAVDLVSTTTETAVFSFSVPENTLGTDKMLRLTVQADLLNTSGSTNNWIARLKFGGTTLVATTTSAVTIAVNRRAIKITACLSALNATNAQYCTLETSQSAAANNLGNGDILVEPRLGSNVGALDTTGALTLELSLQNSVNNVLTSLRCHTAQLELLD